MTCNKRVDRPPGPSGRGPGQPWPYVPERFARLMPLLAILLPMASFSGVSTNVCANSQALSEFDAAHTASVNERDSATEWSVRVPNTFREEFSLAALYRVLEQGGDELLRAPLQTTNKDDAATSFFSIDTEELRRGLVARVFASYTGCPGEKCFDGPFCEFEIGTKQATHGDRFAPSDAQPWS